MRRRFGSPKPRARAAMRASGRRPAAAGPHRRRLRMAAAGRRDRRTAAGRHRLRPVAPCASRLGSGVGRYGPSPIRARRHRARWHPRGEGQRAAAGRAPRPRLGAAGALGVETRAIGPWLHEPRSPGVGRTGLRSRGSSNPSLGRPGTGARRRRSVSPGRAAARLRATIAPDGRPAAGAGPRRSGPVHPPAAGPPPSEGTDPSRPSPATGSPATGARAPPRAPARHAGVPRRRPSWRSAGRSCGSAAARSGRPWPASSRGFSGLRRPRSSAAARRRAHRCRPSATRRRIASPERAVHQPPHGRPDRRRSGRGHRRLGLRDPRSTSRCPTPRRTSSPRSPIGPTSRSGHQPGVAARQRAATTSRPRSSAPAARASRRRWRRDVLDQSKPKVTVTSPKDDAQVNAGRVTIKGKSQAGSSVRLQNGANGAIADGRGRQGRPVGGVLASPAATTDHDHRDGPGRQREHRRAPAGKGSGKMTVVAVGSSYRFRASKRPSA